MGRKEQKLGVRASHTAQVILEDCHVPLDHRLGGEPDAENAGPGALGALMTLEATRPGVAAGALGIARAAFQVALDYAQERKQFGKPLWQHEPIGFNLAARTRSRWPGRAPTSSSPMCWSKMTLTYRRPLKLKAARSRSLRCRRAGCIPTRRRRRYARWGEGRSRSRWT